MTPWIYDTEVFLYDTLVVAKQVGADGHEVLTSPQEVRELFGDPDFIFAGFNTKHYDRFIVQAIAVGWGSEDIKDLNDWIIKDGMEGWDYPPLQDVRFRFNNVDLMDDMQHGLSLKSIEGHLGMDIVESEVDFDLNRPLTADEWNRTVKYCQHDVDATEMLWNLRKDYLDTKIRLGAMCGLTEAQALALTNAKLTARFLNAKLPTTPRDDERDYHPPFNLNMGYIPSEVLSFYERLKDPAVSDEEVFSGKLEIDVGGTHTTLGLGGIHGAIPNYRWGGDTQQ